MAGTMATEFQKLFIAFADDHYQRVGRQAGCDYLAEPLVFRSLRCG
jgi:hypothetical protein